MLVYRGICTFLCFTSVVAALLQRREVVRTSLTKTPFLYSLEEGAKRFLRLLPDKLMILLIERQRFWEFASLYELPL